MKRSVRQTEQPSHQDKSQQERAGPMSDQTDCARQRDEDRRAETQKHEGRPAPKRSINKPPGSIARV